MDKKAEYLRVNRAIFGHESFRSVQGEIIETAMSGKDVFVLLPTGGGKKKTTKV